MKKKLNFKKNLSKKKIKKLEIYKFLLNLQYN